MIFKYEMGYTNIIIYFVFCKKKYNKHNYLLIVLKFLAIFVYTVYKILPNSELQ